MSIKAGQSSPSFNPRFSNHRIHSAFSSIAVDSSRCEPENRGDEWQGFRGHLGLLGTTVEGGFLPRGPGDLCSGGPLHGGDGADPRRVRYRAPCGTNDEDQGSYNNRHLFVPVANVSLALREQRRKVRNGVQQRGCFVVVMPGGRHRYRALCCSAEPSKSSPRVTCLRRTSLDLVATESKTLQSPDHRTPFCPPKDARVQGPRRMTTATRQR